MLRSGKYDTDNLIGDLDGFDFQAGENPKNFGHNFILRLIGQLATDPQGNWFWQTHNDAADSSEKTDTKSEEKGEIAKQEKWKSGKVKKRKRQEAQKQKAKSEKSRKCKIGVKSR